jgi:hypothetical protein
MRLLPSTYVCQMVHSIRRPLLAVAAVFFLGGLSISFPPSCVIPSDAPLLADDARLVDLPELDGRFVYEGTVPFEIVRLGGGHYEYVGPITELPDVDRITPAEGAALEERFGALGLPEPEQTSTGERIPPPELEQPLRELETRCPPVAWYDGRHCARRLAELLEPDYPGVMAFEAALAELPALEFRERARFSLHEIGPGRLAGQIETVYEVRWRPVTELEERWDDTSIGLQTYFWAHGLRGTGPERAEHEGNLSAFEAWMMPYSLAVLQPRDDGSFVIHEVDECLKEERLDAYGFTVRKPDEEPDEEQDDIDFGSIVAGPDADIVGLLNACFPEDPEAGFRFWRIDTPPPTHAVPAG